MAAHLQLPRKKAPNPTDQHVGARVRMRRIMLAMSQGQLADALGITYQQVQKNETGINRIAAGRLEQISHILQVPVAFFFEGAPNAAAPAFLVFLHLLEGEAECGTQLFLAHCKHEAAYPHPAADVVVGEVRDSRQL